MVGQVVWTDGVFLIRFCGPLSVHAHPTNFTLPAFPEVGNLHRRILTVRWPPSLLSQSITRLFLSINCYMLYPFHCLNLSESSPTLADGKRRLFILGEPTPRAVIGGLGRNCENRGSLIINLTTRVRYEDGKDGKDGPCRRQSESGSRSTRPTSLPRSLLVCASAG